MINNLNNVLGRYYYFSGRRAAPAAVGRPRKLTHAAPRRAPAATRDVTDRSSHEARDAAQRGLPGRPLLWVVPPTIHTYLLTLSSVGKYLNTSNRFAIT